MKVWIFSGACSLTLILVAGFVWLLNDVRQNKSDVGQIEWVEAQMPQVGRKAPDFRAIDTQKNSVLLSSRQRVKIVNFWASWCAPCLEEIPSLSALAKREAENIQVIAIAADTDSGALDQTLKIFSDFSNGPIQVVWDPQQKIVKAYAVNGFPESFVVNRAGVLTQQIVGPKDWASCHFDASATDGEIRCP